MKLHAPRETTTTTKEKAMNEKHLNPAATSAEALATEHARTIGWARHLTVHTRDPRLRGKKAPALHCGACQEVYAELEPGNIASTMGHRRS